MKIIPKIPAFLTRPITMPPYRRTIFLVFWGTLVGILAFAGWYAWFSWHRYEQNSQYRLTLESDMVATVTQNLLDGHASGLQFLGVQLQRADALQHPRRARTLLLDYLKATSDIASANLIARNGQVIASTAVPAGKPLLDFRNNPARWPDFQKVLQAHGMRVYHPLRGPLVGDHWVIRLSRTVFSPAGKPLFVVATPLRFNDIEDFLRHLPLRTGTAVGLIRSDFYIEGRWPTPQGDLSKRLAHPVPAGEALRQVLQRAPHARHGTYAGVVAVGAQAYRFGAFTRLSHYPLTAFVSIPRDQWLAAWWRRHIQFPLIFLIVALGFGLVAYRRILFLDSRQDVQRQTLKLFRTLLDNSNDAIEIVDPVTLRFLDINETECLALGYTRGELLSMSICDIDTAYSADPQKVLAQLQESGRALFETIHRRKDGSTFPVEVNVVSVELDRPYLLAITRDITERKALEAAQQDSARRLQRITDFSVLLSSANEAIAQMENEADLLRSLCELAVHHAHLRLAWIGRPDSDGWFQMLAAAGPIGYLAGIRISASAELPEGQGPAGLSWRDQKLVYNASFTKNPRMKPWAQRAEAFGISANAALPIFRGGKRWAVLAMGHGEDDIFDADLQKILTDLAKDVGYGLDRLDILRREREANFFNEALLNTQSSGITVTRFPEGILERVNARMLEMFGASSQEEFLGHPIREFYLNEETYDQVTVAKQKSLSEGHGALRDMPYRRLDGEIIYIDISVQRLDGTDGVQRVLGTLVDVTERHRLVDELARQSFSDMLTGLPNRRALDAEMDKALARSDRQERLLAVGFLDLDDFKPVNDTFGHDAGDDLLKEMARRLQDAVRRMDTVARLGGDEFVLLLEGLRDMNELDQVLTRLQTAIAQPFNIKGEMVSIQASLGLTIYPFDEADADLLLRHADQAMYATKARLGRAREGWVQLYHPDFGTLTVGDETLRQDFLRSLASGAVTLRYQPLVAMATGRVAGLEALTRWHREGQEVSPDRFLPSLGVRERQALGRFVLQMGLQQLAQWRDMGLDLFLSVNVTPEELNQPGFADAVFAILATQLGIPPESLVLEVLEIGEILEQKVVMGHLQRLRSAGVKIALDDVGSAYASLLRLKNLPIDEIKIDQGFIRELSNKPQDLIFVESLVNLGLGMGILITVEGVETEAHIALLREMKVDYLQGYAIARPLEAEAVANFVSTFVLGAGDADTPLLALYQHLEWVRAAAESAINHGLYEHAELAACPITTWLHAHASELPEVETLLAEHKTVHILGREILQVRQKGTREELHRLLGQLHGHSLQFQEGLGQAVKAMRENAEAKAPPPEGANQ
ncbi:EAL domain-containing protein [Acidithiobacillus thiooxidans]|uniref:EAL domain-containing protein n=1 Tax=Acidithiobacillus thiooxidans TaxID=930 RepID=UPI00129DD2F8|nr:EAL domain-containing protein [Acidithiobacillus thiooxidans]